MVDTMHVLCMLQPYENPNDDHIDYDSAESAPSTDEEEEDNDYMPTKRFVPAYYVLMDWLWSSALQHGQRVAVT